METAELLLTNWALVVTSTGAMKDPMAALKRMGKGKGDSLLMVVHQRYVETTFMFDGLRPLLLWHYGKGRSLDTYQLRRPGEPILEAILRHGMGPHYVTELRLSAKEIPFAMLVDFQKELVERQTYEPIPDVTYGEGEESDDLDGTPLEREQLALVAQIDGHTRNSRWEKAAQCLAKLEKARNRARASAV